MNRRGRRPNRTSTGWSAASNTGSTRPPTTAPSIASAAGRGWQAPPCWRSPGTPAATRRPDRGYGSTTSAGRPRSWSTPGWRPCTSDSNDGVTRSRSGSPARVSRRSCTPPGDAAPVRGGRGEPVDLAAARERCPDPVDVDTFYSDMARGSIDSGRRCGDRRGVDRRRCGAGPAPALPGGRRRHRRPAAAPGSAGRRTAKPWPRCAERRTTTRLPAGGAAPAGAAPGRCRRSAGRTSARSPPRRTGGSAASTSGSPTTPAGPCFTVEGVTVQERPAGPALRYSRPSWRPEAVVPARPQPSVLLVATADDMLGFALENLLAPVGVGWSGCGRGTASPGSATTATRWRPVTGTTTGASPRTSRHGA